MNYDWTQEFDCITIMFEMQSNNDDIRHFEAIIKPNKIIIQHKSKKPVVFADDENVVFDEELTFKIHSDQSLWHYDENKLVCELDRIINKNNWAPMNQVFVGENHTRKNLDPPKVPMIELSDDERNYLAQHQRDFLKKGNNTSNAPDDPKPYFGE